MNEDGERYKMIIWATGNGTEFEGIGAYAEEIIIRIVVSQGYNILSLSTHLIGLLESWGSPLAATSSHFLGLRLINYSITINFLSSSSNPHMKKHYFHEFQPLLSGDSTLSSSTGFRFLSAVASAVTVRTISFSCRLRNTIIRKIISSARKFIENSEWDNVSQIV